MARPLPAVRLSAMRPNGPPDRLAINFGQRQVRSDFALAQALAENPSVTCVSLSWLGSLWGQGSRWGEDNDDATLPAFRHTLETRANLQQVIITASLVRTEQAPPSIATPFLRTFMVIPFLRSVRLVGKLRIYAEDLAAFLRAERSAPMSLSLSFVVVESPRGRVQNACRVLTEAMKSSKSIKFLQLRCLQGDAAQAILTGLSTNQSVETLELSWDMVLAAEQSSAQSVHNILKDTKKIKRFILTGLFRLTDTGHKEISKRIATALINSDCVTEIEFEGTNRGILVRNTRK